jgi:hypothetical protein
MLTRIAETDKRRIRDSLLIVDNFADCRRKTQQGEPEMSVPIATSEHYLRREESYMYDREPRFPAHRTMNAARIEYTENGISHVASRRCDMIQVSKHGALLSILTQYHLPTEFYLDLPDAKISKVGCKLVEVKANNTIEVRFLRGLTEKEMNRIFVYSTHPDHRNVHLDLRA